MSNKRTEPLIFIRVYGLSRTSAEALGVKKSQVNPSSPSARKSLSKRSSFIQPTKDGSLDGWTNIIDEEEGSSHAGTTKEGEGAETRIKCTIDMTVEELIRCLPQAVHANYVRNSIWETDSHRVKDVLHLVNVGVSTLTIPASAALRSLEGLRQAAIGATQSGAGLRSLNLSGNMLVSLRHLPSLPNLEDLQLHNNRLTSFAFAPEMPRLTDITIDGNPLSRFTHAIALTAVAFHALPGANSRRRKGQATVNGLETQAGAYESPAPAAEPSSTPKKREEEEEQPAPKSKSKWSIVKASMISSPINTPKKSAAAALVEAGVAAASIRVRKVDGKAISSSERTMAVRIVVKGFSKLVRKGWIPLSTEEGQAIRASGGVGVGVQNNADVSAVKKKSFGRLLVASAFATIETEDSLVLDAASRNHVKDYFVSAWCRNEEWNDQSDGKNATQSQGEESVDHSVQRLQKVSTRITSEHESQQASPDMNSSFDLQIVSPSAGDLQHLAADGHLDDSVFSIDTPIRPANEKMSGHSNTPGASNAGKDSLIRQATANNAIQKIGLDDGMTDENWIGAEIAREELGSESSSASRGEENTETGNSQMASPSQGRADSEIARLMNLSKAKARGRRIVRWSSSADTIQRLQRLFLHLWAWKASVAINEETAHFLTEKSDSEIEDDILSASSMGSVLTGPSKSCFDIVSHCLARVQLRQLVETANESLSGGGEKSPSSGGMASPASPIGMVGSHSPSLQHHSHKSASVAAPPSAHPSPALVTMLIQSYSQVTKPKLKAAIENTNLGQVRQNDMSMFISKIQLFREPAPSSFRNQQEVLSPLLREYNRLADMVEQGNRLLSSPLDGEPDSVTGKESSDTNRTNQEASHKTAAVSDERSARVGDDLDSLVSAALAKNAEILEQFKSSNSGNLRHIVGGEAMLASSYGVSGIASGSLPLKKKKKKAHKRGGRNVPSSRIPQLRSISQSQHRIQSPPLVHVHHRHQYDDAEILSSDPDAVHDEALQAALNPGSMHPNMEAHNTPNPSSEARGRKAYLDHLEKQKAARASKVSKIQLASIFDSSIAAGSMFQEKEKVIGRPKSAPRSRYSSSASDNKSGRRAKSVGHASRGRGNANDREYQDSFIQRLCRPTNAWKAKELQSKSMANHMKMKEQERQNAGNFRPASLRGLSNLTDTFSNPPIDAISPAHRTMVKSSAHYDRVFTDYTSTLSKSAKGINLSPGKSADSRLDKGPDRKSHLPGRRGNHVAFQDSHFQLSDSDHGSPVDADANNNRDLWPTPFRMKKDNAPEQPVSLRLKESTDIPGNEFANSSPRGITSVYVNQESERAKKPRREGPPTLRTAIRSAVKQHTRPPPKASEEFGMQNEKAPHSRGILKKGRVPVASANLGTFTAERASRRRHDKRAIRSKYARVMSPRVKPQSYLLAADSSKFPHRQAWYRPGHAHSQLSEGTQSLMWPDDGAFGDGNELAMPSSDINGNAVSSPARLPSWMTNSNTTAGGNQAGIAQSVTPGMPFQSPTFTGFPSASQQQSLSDLAADEESRMLLAAMAAAQSDAQTPISKLHHHTVQNVQPTPQEYAPTQTRNTLSGHKPHSFTASSQGPITNVHPSITSLQTNKQLMPQLMSDTGGVGSLDSPKSATVFNDSNMTHGSQQDYSPLHRLSNRGGAGSFRGSVKSISDDMINANMPATHTEVIITAGSVLLQFQYDWQESLLKLCMSKAGKLLVVVKRHKINNIVSSQILKWIEQSRKTLSSYAADIQRARIKLPLPEGVARPTANQAMEGAHALALDKQNYHETIKARVLQLLEAKGIINDISSMSGQSGRWTKIKLPESVVSHHLEEEKQKAAFSPSMHRTSQSQMSLSEARSVMALSISGSETTSVRSVSAKSAHKSKKSSNQVSKKLNREHIFQSQFQSPIEASVKRKSSLKPGMEKAEIMESGNSVQKFKPPTRSALELIAADSPQANEDGARILTVNRTSHHTQSVASEEGADHLADISGDEADHGAFSASDMEAEQPDTAIKGGASSPVPDDSHLAKGIPMAPASSQASQATQGPPQSTVPDIGRTETASHSPKKAKKRGSIFSSLRFGKSKRKTEKDAIGEANPILDTAGEEGGSRTPVHENNEQPAEHTPGMTPLSRAKLPPNSPPGLPPSAHDVARTAALHALALPFSRPKSDIVVSDSWKSLKSALDTLAVIPPPDASPEYHSESQSVADLPPGAIPGVDPTVLAYYINTFNAAMVSLCVSQDPFSKLHKVPIQSKERTERLKSHQQILKSNSITINGSKLTLFDLMQLILGKENDTSPAIEGRVHFALCWGVVSGPRARVYHHQHLWNQLRMATIAYFEEDHKRLPPLPGGEQKLRLPRIIEWFRQDFQRGTSRNKWEGAIRFYMQHRPSNSPEQRDAAQVLQLLAAKQLKGLKVAPFEWAAEWNSSFVPSLKHP